MSQKLRDACTAISCSYSEEEVVVAVRRYVASLTPDEAALMPQALTALGLGHPESLVQTALHMVQHEMRAARGAAEQDLIREAVVVLATATRRLALLSAYHTMDAAWGTEQRLQ